MNYDAVLFLVDGFEEIEALATLDILRRGEVDVVSVSLTGRYEVTGSHDIIVRADILFDDLSDVAGTMLILPGGPGRVHYKNHEPLLELLKLHDSEGGKIAAICGAPEVLGTLGLLKNKTAVCHPAVEKELNALHVSHAKVITDKNITTSRAAGTTIDFALELVRILKGADTAHKIASAIA